VSIFHLLGKKTWFLLSIICTFPYQTILMVSSHRIVTDPSLKCSTILPSKIHMPPMFGRLYDQPEYKLFFGIRGGSANPSDADTDADTDIDTDIDNDLYEESNLEMDDESSSISSSGDSSAEISEENESSTAAEDEIEESDFELMEHDSLEDDETVEEVLEDESDVDSIEDDEKDEEEEEDDDIESEDNIVPEESIPSEELEVEEDVLNVSLPEVEATDDMEGLESDTFPIVEESSLDVSHAESYTEPVDFQSTEESVETKSEEDYTETNVDSIEDERMVEDEDIMDMEQEDYADTNVDSMEEEIINMEQLSMEDETDVEDTMEENVIDTDTVEEEKEEEVQMLMEEISDQYDHHEGQLEGLEEDEKDDESDIPSGPIITDNEDTEFKVEEEEEEDDEPSMFDDDFVMETYNLPTPSESILQHEESHTQNPPPPQESSKSTISATEDDSCVDKMDFADAYDDGDASTAPEEISTQSQSIPDMEEPSPPKSEIPISSTTEKPLQPDIPPILPSAGIQFMITSRMRNILIQNLGYSNDDVDQLRPEMASAIIKKMIQRPSNGIPPAWCQPPSPSNKITGLIKTILTPTLKIGIPAILAIGLRSTVITSSNTPSTSKIGTPKTNRKNIASITTSDTSNEFQTSPPSSSTESISSLTNDSKDPTAPMESNSPKKPKQTNTMDQTWLDKSISFLEGIWSAEY